MNNITFQKSFCGCWIFHLFYNANTISAVDKLSNITFNSVMWNTTHWNTFFYTSIFTC